MMAVNINKWEFRPLNLVVLGDERGLRLVFLNGWYSLFLRSLPLQNPRQCCRRSRRPGVWPDKQKNHSCRNGCEECKSTPRFHHPPLVRDCQLIFPQDG